MSLLGFGVGSFEDKEVDQEALWERVLEGGGSPWYQLMGLLGVGVSSMASVPCASFQWAHKEPVLSLLSHLTVRRLKPREVLCLGKGLKIQRSPEPLTLRQVTSSCCSWAFSPPKSWESHKYHPGGLPAV